MLDKLYEEEWAKLPKERSAKLLVSEQFKAVVAAKGGSMK